MNIKYISSSLSPSGYASAARADILALYCAGVNVTCQSIQQTAEHTDYGLESCFNTHLENRNIPYKIAITHLTPDIIPDYQEKGIYTISRLAWETDRLPDMWIQPLNNCAEIWTMSQPMVNMIKKSGVHTLCTVIPEPVETRQETVEQFHIKKDFMFYSIFQWIDRKAPQTLLHAYWKAFEGNDDVTLLLKTYRVNYSNQEFELLKKDIKNWKDALNLKHYPKLFLARNLLTGTQMQRLHATGDCYVSASAGEGWGRPMAEAMVMGKPVITADNGGITDWCTTQHYFVVPGASCDVTEASHIPWYKHPMQWKLPDEESLGKQMKYVYENYETAKAVGKKAQSFMIDHFSYRQVGDMMRQRLEEIQKIF